MPKHLAYPVEVPDRALWLRLPASVWIWLRGYMLEDLLDETLELEEEPWREDVPAQDEREHQGRVLLALREVIQQAVPPPQYNEVVRGQDEIQADLFGRWGFIPGPADHTLVRELVIDPDRDYPRALQRLRTALAELGGR